MAERRTPPNAASAANSVLFGTAKALVHRKVGLGDFTSEELQDTLALSIACRKEGHHANRICETGESEGFLERC